MAFEPLDKDPMMSHLAEALRKGRDIGHYGRLVFAMIGRYFLSEAELVSLLARNPDFDEAQARLLLRQIDERGYNPPKRERVLEWMTKQDFPICPDPQDRGQCNVYRNLEFPKEVYDKIADFYAGERLTQT